jgi:hypothetical protein
VFLCDEDGHSNRKPQNVRGQLLYGPSSMIVGDIVVIPRNYARKWM